VYRLTDLSNPSTTGIKHLENKSKPPHYRGGFFLQKYV
jgi:hypothetical protein